MQPKFISGHQPMLFGTAGYWSKIAVADLHIVCIGVPFRRHDKLASATLLEGGHIAIPLSDGDCINDVDIAAPLDKTLKAIKMIFGSKRSPYRSRLDPIVALFEKDPRDYVDLWLGMASAIINVCGLNTALSYAVDSDDGVDTLDRLENRVIGRAVGPFVYVSGPGASGYVDRKPKFPMVIHRMIDPKPTPFLYDLVTMEQPMQVLKAYTLEAVR